MGGAAPSAEAIITWLRAHQGEDLVLTDWQWNVLDAHYANYRRRWAVGADMPVQPNDLGGTWPSEAIQWLAQVSEDRPDSASPDTSQPYFLDLLARIDEVTEERPNA